MTPEGLASMEKGLHLMPIEYDVTIHVMRGITESQIEELKEGLRKIRGFTFNLEKTLSEIEEVNSK